MYPGNVPKNYDDVSTVKVENYINRIYIDLLGREPLDVEVIRDVKYLRDNDLSYDARKVLINRLMTDTIFVVGDSCYKKAYYQRLYDLAKARLLEGADDGEFSQQIGIAQFGVTVSRLNGDSIGVFAAMATIPAYCEMLVKSREFHEGMIKWAYLTLIGREPNTQETYNLMADFYLTGNFQKVQLNILATDEYAHF